MIPSGATLSFTEFVSDTIAWEIKDALQQFFEDIRVPVGTTSAYGTFKQVVSTEFEETELTNSDTFNLQVDGVTLGEVPTKESFVELKNAFIALQTSYNELLGKMRTSKILDE